MSVQGVNNYGNHYNPHDKESREKGIQALKDYQYAKEKIAKHNEVTNNLEKQNALTNQSRAAVSNARTEASQATAKVAAVSQMKQTNNEEVARLDALMQKALAIKAQRQAALQSSPHVKPIGATS